MRNQRWGLTAQVGIRNQGWILAVGPVCASMGESAQRALVIELRSGSDGLGGCPMALVAPKLKEQEAAAAAVRQAMLD